MNQLIKQKENYGKREALAIWLKKEYLNELCRGKYAFTPREQEENMK